MVLLGLVCLVEVDLVVWLRVRRNRDVIVEEVDVTLTDEIIRRKTATVTAEYKWGTLSRIIDGRDFWIFVVNRLNVVMLWKAFLTPEQRAEFEGFLAKNGW